MNVFVGADHRGFEYKEKIKQTLQRLGYKAVDCGTDSSAESCDYPKVAYEVATRVASAKADRGILVCMSGIGQTIAANKIRGAYAALCYNAQAAKLSRQHNNANILVLSSKFVKTNQLGRVLKIWLETPFEGGRHQRRVNQIKRIERNRKP